MSLTGMRGVAAWWVVVYHFRETIPQAGWEGTHGLIDRGYLAVDLFFVLSGFIISMNYLALFETFSWAVYLRFLTLRLGRIYPLHLFMMLAFLLNPLAILMLSHAHAPGGRYEAGYFGMSLLLIQNWGLTNNLAWNVPAWSISTEWFAYLIFPGLAIWQQFAYTRLRAAAGIAGALLLLAVLSETVEDDIPANGLFRCVLEFAAGGSVFLLCKHQGNGRRRISECATVGSLVTVCAMSWLPLPAYPIAALAWCGLIYGIADNTTYASRVLSIPLIYAIGEYSYSTYLVHYFVRDWIKFCCVGHDVPWAIELLAYLIATAIASFVLYRTVECPGRRLVRDLVDRSWLSAPARRTI